MPTVTFNKAAFLKLVGKKLSDGELKERVSMLGTSVETVSATEMTVEVFPNRPDFLSEQGLARAVASSLGMKKGLRTYDVKKSNYKVIVESSVAAVRPYTACALVKNLKLDDMKIKQIIQMQEKLHVTYGRNRKKVAIGIYPLEKITMPIHYLAKKPSDIRFHPLDAKGIMTGAEILERHPTGKAYGHLLEQATVFPLFMDAKKQILSMPPIINSEETGRVTNSTKEVFIECSGHDRAVLETCLNMIVTALAEMGGTIYSIDVQYGTKKVTTPDLAPRKMQLNIDYVNQRLGVTLTETDVQKLLERMGYGFAHNHVLVPAYRADVLHEIDLVEDIAIAYGFEHFHETIPKVATVAEEHPFEVFKNRIATILVGYGLQEVHTYNLTSKRAVNEKMQTHLACVELANALNEDYNILRPWVLPSVLHILENNTHHEYPQLLFGTGTVFAWDKTQESGVREHVRLAVTLCAKDANFTSIKQLLDGLCAALAVQPDMKKTDHPSFIPGRVGRVSIHGKDLAYIGEIHPSVLEQHNLQMPVAAFELNLSELYDILMKER